MISFRRADGGEVSLSKFSIEQLLQSGETLRAEEIVLSVPDGRSVRTLVNATPIRTEGDAVGSLVTTGQDLAPLDEIERQRIEFLGLVSHELREPLAAIKGSAVTLLEDSALDSAEMREFHRIIAAQADHMRGLIGDLLDAGRIDSGMLSVAPESSELFELVERARSTCAQRLVLPPHIVGLRQGSSLPNRNASWSAGVPESRLVARPVASGRATISNLYRNDIIRIHFDTQKLHKKRYMEARYIEATNAASRPVPSSCAGACRPSVRRDAW